MSKYIESWITPGPWQIQRTITGAKDDIQPIDSDYSLDKHYMARVESPEYVFAEIAGRTPEEAQANAHLIAAAPEMLEALKLAQATIDRLHRHAPGSANGTLDIVKAAIAKAEGRAQ